MLFENLPEEILCIIFDHLCPEIDYSFEHQPSYDPKKESSRYVYSQNLLNLVLCSHLFYKLGMPYLYRDLEPATTRSWMTYIRATLHQPDLACYTKSINLSMNRYSYFANPAQLSNWPETGISSARDEEAMRHHMDSRTISHQQRFTDSESSHDSETPTNDLRFGSIPFLGNDVAVENRPPAKGGRGFKILRSVFKRTKKSFPESKTSTRLHGPVTATQDIVYSALSGDEQSAIVYLIYCLPNLESISLTLEAGRFANKSDEIISVLNPDLINIPHLRSFTLNYTERYGARLRFNNFFPLLLQPSMRSFSASNILERNWLPTPRNAKLTLTHLSFPKTSICNNSLEAMLHCCPQLESFRYEQRHVYHEHPFIPRYLAASLRHLNKTLRHLTLHHPEQPLFDDLDSHHRLQFTTTEEVLRTFEVLRSLDITAHLLLGPQEHPDSRWWLESLKYTDLLAQSLMSCLPRSLEELTLRDCAESVRDESRELSVCGMMPFLKKIELHFLFRIRIEMPGSVEKCVWEEEDVGGVQIRSCCKIDGVLS